MDKKANPHKGHRNRMIDRMSKNGGDTMATHEILEMMLYKCYESKNTNNIAHNLLNKFDGSIYKVCNATVEELMQVEGVGLATAKYLTLYPEFFSAYSKSRKNKDFCYDTIDKIGDYCVDLLSKSETEELYILCFNAGRKLIKAEKIMDGTPDSVSIEPRKIISAIIKTSAVEVVLCHNHPGGTIVHSQNDISYTQQLKVILEMVNIDLLCHIVVANGEYLPLFV